MCLSSKDQSYAPRPALNNAKQWVGDSQPFVPRDETSTRSDVIRARGAAYFFDDIVLEVDPDPYSDEEPSPRISYARRRTAGTDPRRRRVINHPRIRKRSAKDSSAPRRDQILKHLPDLWSLDAHSMRCMVTAMPLDALRSLTSEKAWHLNKERVFGCMDVFRLRDLAEGDVRLRDEIAQSTAAKLTLEEAFRGMTLDSIKHLSRSDGWLGSQLSESDAAKEAKDEAFGRMDLEELKHLSESDPWYKEEISKSEAAAKVKQTAFDKMDIYTLRRCCEYSAWLNTEIFHYLKRAFNEDFWLSKAFASDLEAHRIMVAYLCAQDRNDSPGPGCLRGCFGCYERKPPSGFESNNRPLAVVVYPDGSMEAYPTHDQKQNKMVPEIPVEEPARKIFIRRLCMECGVKLGIYQPGSRIESRGQTTHWVCYCRRLRLIRNGGSDTCPLCCRRSPLRNPEVVIPSSYGGAYGRHSASS